MGQRLNVGGGCFQVGAFIGGGGSQGEGWSLWDRGCWARVMDAPAPASPEAGAWPTRPSPCWSALVGLTPGRLWDKGSGGLCSLPRFCSPGSSSQVWPPELQEPGRTNYHQHAIGDEALGWRGTGKERETPGQLCHSCLISQEVLKNL